MIEEQLTYKRFGESALLIEWPPEVNETILKDILSFQFLIEKQLNEFLIETVNAYNSLTLIFHADKITFEGLENELKKLYDMIDSSAPLAQQNLWNLPVCYDEHFGIDLQEISNTTGLAISEIIRLHVDAVYTVYFIGFLPGFLYLGGLPSSLHFPRKKTPRLKIEKGAVAIGGEQTGIYPMESPGGWNIIGSSPISLFDVNSNPPCQIKSGDQVRFRPISIEKFEQIKSEVRLGIFDMKNELA